MTDKARASTPLKPVQVEMVQAHLMRLSNAQAALDAAQRVLAAEQENANLFVTYCARELGATADQVFDQSAMAFVPRGEEGDSHG